MAHVSGVAQQSEPDRGSVPPVASTPPGIVLDHLRDGKWDTSEVVAWHRLRTKALRAAAYRKGVPESEIDDVVGETWFRFINYCRFERINDETHAANWLYMALKSVIVGERGKSSRLPMVALDDLAAGFDIAGDFEPAFRNNISLNLQKALSRLTSLDRQVLAMRVCHEMSAEEVGLRLGKSPNAVGAQLCRAKKRLSVLLRATTDTKES